jgi:hypothetical protein
LHMEYRRREIRFEIDQPVVVSDLQLGGTPLEGRLANFSANGIRLMLNRKLDPGTMVKVVWGNTLLLGEIIYCRAEGSEFATGLELEDALYETDSLASLAQTWTADEKLEKWPPRSPR